MRDQVGARDNAHELPALDVSTLDMAGLLAWGRK
jgi:hypothetical protein